MKSSYPRLGKKDIEFDIAGLRGTVDRLRMLIKNYDAVMEAFHSNDPETRAYSVSEIKGKYVVAIGRTLQSILTQVDLVEMKLIVNNLSSGPTGALVTFGVRNVCRLDSLLGSPLAGKIRKSIVSRRLRELHSLSDDQIIDLGRDLSEWDVCFSDRPFSEVLHSFILFVYSKMGF